MALLAYRLWGAAGAPWTSTGRRQRLMCRCSLGGGSRQQPRHTFEAAQRWGRPAAACGGGRGRVVAARAFGRRQAASQDAADANKYSEEVLEWLNAPDAPETSARAGRSNRSVAWRRRPAADAHHAEAASTAAQVEGALRASGVAAVGRADGRLRGDTVMMTMPPRRMQPGAAPVSAAAGIGYDLMLLAAGVVLAQLVLPFRRRQTVQPHDPLDKTAKYFPKGEPVEWVNMCLRKLWRVYQRGLERWITELLQPVFDWLIEDVSPAALRLRRLKILEFTLDHESPTFSNMRRRNSRKDSDLSGVVDCRYTGGAKMLLELEFGVGRLKSVKVPVMVSDLDLQGKLWIKLRLAPMCPWIGTISLAFVGAPRIQVQLSPYNRVPLMRVPIIQKLLAKLLIEDLPALMVLPERLDINIPASITTLAEAAVGRDAIMQAVASAVLQAEESKEMSLASALPLGKQGAAGGIVLPDLFVGEVAVLLRQGRNLPVWGTSISSNPWCRIVLGEQAVLSKRNRETSTLSDHRNPVWNQDFQFLVQDPETACLEFYVKDSHLTGRTSVGVAVLPLISVPDDRTVSMWIPVMEKGPGGERKTEGELLVEICYKPFEDEEDGPDDVYSTFVEDTRGLPSPIVDIKSAADASSRANVAQSAAVAAVAVTKAAAARAATRTVQAAQAAGSTTVKAAQAAGSTTVKASQAAGNTARAAASQLSKVNPLGSRDRSTQDESSQDEESGDSSSSSQSNGVNGNGVGPQENGNGRGSEEVSTSLRDPTGPEKNGGVAHNGVALPSPVLNGHKLPSTASELGGATEVEATSVVEMEPLSYAEVAETGVEEQVEPIDQEAESRKMVEIALKKVYSELGKLEEEKKKAENGAPPTEGRPLALIIIGMIATIAIISRVLMCINGIVD